MFEDYESYEHIIVTGPQRSGTRIATACIGVDTGKRIVDEMNFFTDSPLNCWHLMYENKDHDEFVVQAPSMLRNIKLFGREDTLVVCMIRDIDDIVASMERENLWNWDFIQYERDLWEADTFHDIVEKKYELWKSVRHKLPNYDELPYESLSEHKLWVPKEERKNWGGTQIARGTYAGR